MVLFATFASLRWGEVTALRRSDIDLRSGSGRLHRAVYWRAGPRAAEVQGRAPHGWHPAGNRPRADDVHDGRYRAMVLLATFASLRWGEMTALRRSDIDLRAGTIRVRAAYIERSTGPLALGPPKSKAGRRVVGIPQAIIPALREHLSLYVRPEPGALVFAGVKGGPIRRSNFNKMSAWPNAVRAIDAEGLHFHDLRHTGHTGNAFAARSGTGLKDLMARMGHDSERAALIYQHEARGADTAITKAIDAHVDAQRARDDGNDDGLPGTLIPAG
ncbi:MAG: site-specific integrase [Micromonosporaceae bacterium]